MQAATRYRLNMVAVHGLLRDLLWTVCAPSFLPKEKLTYLFCRDVTVRKIPLVTATSANYGGLCSNLCRPERHKGSLPCRTPT